MNRILLFSRPIRSGKTTELMNALPYLGRVGGILCPDKNNLRQLYSVSLQAYYPLQSEVAIEGKTLEIGRFHFFIDGFSQAQKILLNDAAQGFDYIVADEVGKLEMRKGQGLEPALSELIHGYKTEKFGGNLLLVVRDFLLDDVRAFYELQQAEVIHDLKTWTSE